MFGIGPGEIVIILVIALIVFGPGKLPEMGSALGKTIGEFKRATSDMTKDFTETVDQVKQPIAEVKDLASGEGLKRAVGLSEEVADRVCPKCSVKNPAEAKFCGSCGAPLG